MLQDPGEDCNVYEVNWHRTWKLTYAQYTAAIIISESNKLELEVNPHLDTYDLSWSHLTLGLIFLM